MTKEEILKQIEKLDKVPVEWGVGKKTFAKDLTSILNDGEIIEGMISACERRMSHLIKGGKMIRSYLVSTNRRLILVERGQMILHLINVFNRTISISKKKILSVTEEEIPKVYKLFYTNMINVITNEEVYKFYITGKMQEYMLMDFQQNTESEYVREGFTIDKSENQRYCVFCGNLVENDWVICPNCGKHIKNDNGDNANNKHGKKQRKKRKNLVGIIIGIVIAIIVGIYVSISKDNSNEELEKMVQNGTYGEYTAVNIGDVLEYNWKDGEWDSFVSEKDDEDIQIVEYAKDSNTLIQFEVIEEEINIVHMENQGIAIQKEELDKVIKDLYFTYFNEIYPLNNLDLADYVESGIEKLLDASSAFYETDKDIQLYEDVSRQILITPVDDSLGVVSIEGDSTYSPVFAGYRIGNSLSEINVSELEKRGYTIPISENEYFKQFGNPNNKSIVIYEADENGIIMSIKWMADVLEDSENIGNEYVFPDSDKKYLSEEEVRSVEIDQLAIGRNEIFARHGYIFQEEMYREYFESKSWYTGTTPPDQFNADLVFNDFEKKNVEMIKRIEDEVNGVTTSSQDFIGMDGVYICTTPIIDSITGRIEILSVGNGSLQYSLGALEMPQEIVIEEAQIIDSNTAQANLNGYIITFTWSDAENMYVTGAGEEPTGMDSGPIVEITSGMRYIRAAEFNQY